MNQERPTPYLEALMEAGIRVPRSAAPLVTDLVEVERCILATGATPTGADVYFMTLNRLFPDPGRDSMVLGHAGHGVNSYQLVLAISQHSVLIVAGTGWQGIYMDAAEQVERFNSRVDLIDDLLAAASQSLRLAALPHGSHLLVEDNDFGGGTQVIIAEPLPDRVPYEMTDGPAGRFIRKGVDWLS